MLNNDDSQDILSLQEFANKCRIMDEACRQWCAFIDEALGRRDGLLFTEFFYDICRDKYEEYLTDPSYREECNDLAGMMDEDRYNFVFENARLADERAGESHERLKRQEQRNHYLLYSCNEWCEKSKASLILATSDKKTLYAAIGGEILVGNMEYLGESGGKGFAEYKKDYLSGKDVLKELQYGFIKEMDDSLLSASDSVSEYYTAASEFLAADFNFDAAAFDKTYSSEDYERGELDEEHGDEI